MMSFQCEQLRKYFIMGSQDCGERDPVHVLEEALAAGITAFQFREKGVGSLNGEDKQVLGETLREQCARFEVPFFVNDDIDLAATLRADGVHVGQGDERVERVRERLPGKIIGLSVSDEDELKDSPIALVDYVGAGAVFPTSSKTDVCEVAGTEWIQTLRTRYPELPIVGIGGITVDNTSEVIEAGADGVSVISAIAGADDISEAVRML